jgi:hypothetical protein
MIRYVLTWAPTVSPPPLRATSTGELIARVIASDGGGGGGGEVH